MDMEPDLSLVPEARAPPNGCCPTWKKTEVSVELIRESVASQNLDLRQHQYLYDAEKGKMGQLGARKRLKEGWYTTFVIQICIPCAVGE
jgi:hypothetical protein